MLVRYFEILPFLDSSYTDIEPLMINSGENMKMKKLISALEKVESVTLKLQREDLDLASAKILFDELIKPFPQMGETIGKNAKVVHSPNFENVFVQVLLEEVEHLTKVEKKNEIQYTKIPTKETAFPLICSKKFCFEA